VIDMNEEGALIGIELLDPENRTVEAVNDVLHQHGLDAFESPTSSQSSPLDDSVGAGALIAAPGCRIPVIGDGFRSPDRSPLR
jgi:hypothetical protein